MTDADLADLLRRVVREELARHGSNHVRGHDRRLAGFLVAAEAFCGSGPWTAAELLEDSRRARRSDLLDVLDKILRNGGIDPAKALGRFLQRHADLEVDGYRLNRCRREAGSWVYSVTRE